MHQESPPRGRGAKGPGKEHVMGEWRGPGRAGVEALPLGEGCLLLLLLLHSGTRSVGSNQDNRVSENWDGGSI